MIHSACGHPWLRHAGTVDGHLCKDCSCRSYKAVCSKCSTEVGGLPQRLPSGFVIVHPDDGGLHTIGPETPTVAVSYRAPDALLDYLADLSTDPDVRTAIEHEIQTRAWEALIAAMARQFGVMPVARFYALTPHEIEIAQAAVEARK